MCSGRGSLSFHRKIQFKSRYISLGSYMARPGGAARRVGDHHRYTTPVVPSPTSGCVDQHMSYDVCSLPYGYNNQHQPQRNAVNWLLTTATRGARRSAAPGPGGLLGLRPALPLGASLIADARGRNSTSATGSAGPAQSTQSADPRCANYTHTWRIRPRTPPPAPSAASCFCGEQSEAVASIPLRASRSMRRRRRGPG
jgi:hypothetical protein